MAALIAFPAVGSAQEIAPPTGRRKHTPYKKGSMAVNVNPNRYEDGRKEPVRGTAERLGCGLTPHEELLVTELRSSLRYLEEQRTRVAAREAALRTLHMRVLEDLTELRRLQDQVGGKLMKMEVTVAEYKAEQKLNLRLRREQEARLRDLKQSERDRADATQRIETVHREQTEAAAAAEKEVGERLAAMQSDTTQAESDRKRRETVERRKRDREQRIGQLAGILKKMRPGQAAAILARQPPKIAVGVLEALGSRMASKIMASMSPEDATQMTSTLLNKPFERPKTPDGENP